MNPIPVLPLASTLPNVPAWVYLFSHFTSEALLFESLGIFILVSAYTAFWVVKKRRFGPVDEMMPAGPIKTYLNQLITEAEQLRIQLFGLLSHTVEPKGELSLDPKASAAANAKHSHLFDTMKRNMTEQVQMIKKITGEKDELAKELEALKAQMSTLSASEEKLKSQNDDAIKLEQKVHELEEKLGEYNIIEDDLANLKRFQQENVKLKGLLQQNGIAVPSAPSAAAASAPGMPADAEAEEAPAEDSRPEPSFPRLVPDPPAAEPEMSSEPAPSEEVFPPVPHKAPAPAKEPAAVAPTEIAASVKDHAVPEETNPDPLAVFGALAEQQEKASQGAIGTEQAQKAEDDLVKEFERMLRK